MSTEKPKKYNVGGTIRKVKIRTSPNSDPIYATVESQVGDKIITDKGEFRKSDIIHEFNVDRRHFMSKGGDVKEYKKEKIGDYTIETEPLPDNKGKTRIVIRNKKGLIMGFVYPSFKYPNPITTEEALGEFKKKENESSMAKGGNVKKNKNKNMNTTKSKLQSDIATLERALDNSLLDDTIKEKARIKIEEKKLEIKSIEEKSLLTQSSSNKSVYIDIDKQFKSKIRNVLASNDIPYKSKTDGDVFRVYLSNQQQLDLVADLYNEKRKEADLRPVDKRDISRINKKRVGSIKFKPVKSKPNVKSKLIVEKKRVSTIYESGSVSVKDSDKE